MTRVTLVTTMSPNWLLYGASGYTGELIAREAVKRGMRPILAGRSQAKIDRLAAELGCPRAVFALEDHTSLVSSLEGVAAVLHCAGPFSQTSRPMMQACLASHVHYLDITGEIAVFELAHGVHEKAQRAGIVLCPGVGFDVVPTDCVAIRLKQALPDATHLTLAFDGGAGLSKGTAKTAIESIGFGSRLRRDGKLIEEPLGARTRRIDFGAGERLSVGIPWGDIATAYYSTGIANIEVFTASSPQAVKSMQRANLFRGLLRKRWVQSLIKRVIDHRLQPPTQTQRDNNPSFVWGEVRNAAGRRCIAQLRTANGYALTVNSSLGVLAELLARPHAPGYTTPGQLVGPEFVTRLPGSSEIRISEA